MNNSAFCPRHLSWMLRAVLPLALAAWCAQGGAAPIDVPRPPDAPTGTDALFASPTTRDHIGRVVVPVMINGRGPFRFIVDTGANHSTITPKLVATLGLKQSDDASVLIDGITGTARASFITVDRLQAGDLTLDGAVLPVVWAPTMAGADGILGVAGLGEKSVIIDFQRNRVEIARHLQSMLRPQAIRIHALPPSRGLIALDSRVGGTHVIAIVDTGAERTLGNLALRDSLKKPRARGVPAQITSVYGATQQIEQGEILRAPPISIESMSISDVQIVYGDFHIFKVWALADKPAMIIGMDVLGTLASLSIDFKNRDLYITSARNDSWRPFTPGVSADSGARK